MREQAHRTIRKGGARRLAIAGVLALGLGLGAASASPLAGPAGGAARAPEADTGAASREDVGGERDMPLGAGRRSAPGPTSVVRERGSAGTVISTVGPLAGVVGLILVGAWGLKKYARTSGSLALGGRSPAGIVSVLGRYSMSRNSALVLVRVDRRVLVVAQTGGRAPSLSTLSEITGEEEVASIVAKAMASERAGAFGGLMKRVEQELEKDASLVESGGGAGAGDARGVRDVHDTRPAVGAPGGRLRSALASMVSGSGTEVEA